MKKGILLGALLLSSSFCTGQVVWQNYGGLDGTSTSAGGFFHLPDGRWGLNFAEYADLVNLSDVNVRYALLDNYAFDEIPMWDTTDWIVGGYYGYWSDASQAFTFTTYPFNGAGAYYGMISLNLDPGLQVIGKKYFRYPANYFIPWSTGGAQLRDAQSRLIVINDVVLSSFQGDQAITMGMIASNGDSLTSRTYLGPFGSRDMYETGSGYALLCDAAPDYGPEGRSKVLFLDETFEITGGFALNGVPDTPIANGLESFLFYHEVEPLPSGDLLFAATFSTSVSGSPTASPFLFKYTADGTLLDTLRGLPVGVNGAHQDFCSAFTKLSDGTYLWHFMEGTPPGSPSRDHFMKVDTLLNVLVDVVLEDAAGTYSYYINGVAEADDGDLLICGQAEVLGSQWVYSSYVAKITGFATGLEEQHTPPRVDAYPNPGTYFRIQSNQPVPNTTLEVTDVRGALMLRTTLPTVQAEVDARGWPSGLYHYRVLRSDGQVIGTGKWVRE